MDDTTKGKGGSAKLLKILGSLAMVGGIVVAATGNVAGAFAFIFGMVAFVVGRFME